MVFAVLFRSPSTPSRTEKFLELGVVAHTFDPSTEKPREADGSLDFEACCVYIVSSRLARAT